MANLSIGRWLPVLDALGAWESLTPMDVNSSLLARTFFFGDAGGSYVNGAYGTDGECGIER